MFPCREESSISIQGLLGTAQVDSETTLLKVLDENKERGVQMNASVMRRGLKSLINTDFRLEAWDNMVTRSYETVQQRLSAEGENSKDATSFYAIMCGQTLQKLIRTSTGKFKVKD